MASPQQQQQQTTNASESASPSPPHPQITFTFPVFIVSQPSSENGATAPDQQPTPQAQVNFPPEALQHLFVHFLRAMPHIFMGAPGHPGQFEPMPNAPPKKHATQSALDRLTPVDPKSLPDTDRRCNICMQDYWVQQIGPRSPYVTDVKDEEDYAVVTPCVEGGGLTEQMDGVETPTMIDEVKKEEEEEAGKPEDTETPVQMPCGHIFGAKCLKEWLYQSPTCPLCRVEVESYVDEPTTQQPPPFTFPQPQPEDQTQGNEPMNIDSQDTETPHPPQFAFQFIFTAPPPEPPSTESTPATTPSPNISRPGTSHSIRHHPYARSTSSLLSAATPSVQTRPDLFCAQRQSGLCSHDEIEDEDGGQDHDHEHEHTLLRLDCGHAFHPDCLDGAMTVEGYPVLEGSDERRCPRCRRWGRIQ